MSRCDEWWPFEDDARRDDPLTELRIAVTTSHPGWAYLVGFDAASEERPTDAEARMLQSYLAEYIDHWYNGGFKSKLAGRALDVDGGANGVVFHKWGDNDWGYRRRSWTMGPLFWPGPSWYRDRYSLQVPASGLSLQALMDHIHDRPSAPGEVSPRWAEWKAAHLEVFGAEAVNR